MFPDAYEIATKFTFPVVLMQRLHNRKCRSGIGAFVVLNSDGWALTAGHILKQFIMARELKARFEKFEQGEQRIANAGLGKAERKRARRSLGDPRSLVRNWGEIWGLPGGPSKIAEGFLNEIMDLAVVRLEPFDASKIELYPKLVSRRR